MFCSTTFCITFQAPDDNVTAKRKSVLLTL
jgi:hypothetical protein